MLQSRKGSGLGRKHWAFQGRTLLLNLQAIVIYGRKKFYETETPSHCTAGGRLLHVCSRRYKTF
jgi:hypothetical protein